MPRRLALALSLGLVTTGLMAFGPAQPAVATDVCAGDGWASLGYPGLLAPMMPLATALGTHLNVLLLQDSLETLPFWFLSATAACTPDFSTLGATGAVNGYCGHSAGSGTDNDGHDFGWIEVGTIMLITGELTGIGQIQPNPITVLLPSIVDNCYASSAWHKNRQGATTFFLHFAFTRANCVSGWTLIPFLTLVWFPLPPAGLPIFTQSLLSVVINVHSDGVVAFHFHGFLHVCTNPTKL